jgi:bacterioferritin (cytochrome b1)
MAANLDASARPEVAEALNGVYKPVIVGMDQVHEQESVFGVRFKWERLKKEYDALGEHFHDWRHCLLRRIIRLGGTPDAGIGTQTTDDVKVAYENTLDCLETIYGTVTSAIAVATSQNDHPTHKILMQIQACVDKKIACIQAKLRQIKDLGDDYLITVARS